MSRITLWLSVFLLGLVATTVHATDTCMNTPIGYWKTIDDVTGKPKSIVQIWKTDNDLLMGRVVKIFPQPGTQPSLSQNKICTACSGNLHNKPIVGMVIISGLKASESQKWGQGKILDPENGKSYNVSLRTADNGNKLDVHDYIGIPLLGRSQTWERVDLMSDK